MTLLSPSVSILDTLDDPELFALLFAGTSWQAWRAFLAALFALPMDAGTLAAYRHHTGRQEPPTAAFAEAALIVGRRGGKSRVLALLAVFLAVFRDYRDRLAPGEAATVAIIAADRKQARSVMRFMVGMFNAVPLLTASPRGTDRREPDPHHWRHDRNPHRKLPCDPGLQLGCRNLRRGGVLAIGRQQRQPC